jgi:hypothetical protein
MPVDVRLLRRLSRLSVNCVGETSFHRTVALLSSVFDQLSHLSLTLFAFISIFDPFTISGDTIQQLCIDRLKPSATYSLILSFYVRDDLKENTILKSFYKAPFTRRQRPRVFIQERDTWDFSHGYYGFMVYTLPYNSRILLSYLFTEDLQKYV